MNNELPQKYLLSHVKDTRMRVSPGALNARGKFLMLQMMQSSAPLQEEWMNKGEVLAVKKEKKENTIVIINFL